MSIISDPKVFGPGLWYSIHITALKTSEDFFLDWIVIIVSNIPCLKCKTHAQEYLNKNPPSLYKNSYNESGELIGMFEWSWLFHNSVNSRLNKNILDYPTAYRMYSEASENCSLDCGN